MKFDFVKGQFSDVSIDQDRVAVVGTDRSLTWKQLASEVEALMTALTPFRTDAPLPVMIYGHKEAGVVSSILACLGLRIPYVPVDTIMPALRVEKIGTLAKINVVLNQTNEAIAGFTNISGRTAKVMGPMHPRHEVWDGATDLAYIIFTSGSSGEPKGVQISRSNVADLAEWVAALLQLESAKDRTYAIANVSLTPEM